MGFFDYPKEKKPKPKPEPTPADLGSGMAADAAKKIKGRRKTLDEQIEEQSRGTSDAYRKGGLIGKKKGCK